MDADRSGLPDEVTVALGKHVGAIDPAGNEFVAEYIFPREKLLAALTEHKVRTNKDGTYITRPMLRDGIRGDQNAGAWRLIPVDIDELQPGEVPALLRWAEESKLAGCLATTFSHSPKQPKVRLWFFASRDIEASEHAFVHRALTRMVPFKTDPCMNKPSQPVFLPACPPEGKGDAFSRVMEGDPLDVDRLLEGYRGEIEEEQRKRAERISGAKTGVRQAGGLIDYFNSNFDLSEFLEHHGYRRKGRNRYISPASKSGRAAVVLYEHAVVSFHDPEHDPLAVRNEYAQAIMLDSFAAFCKLEHQDDFKAAFAGALKWARKQGWSDSAVPEAKKSDAPSAPLILFNALDIFGNLRPQDMLVEGILDKGSVVICAGDSNSGKTTIMQLLALQIARGEPFAGKRVKQGRVLWIAGEDMENAKYRTVAMCEEYGIDPQTLGDELLLLPQPVAVLDEASMAALRDAVEQRVGAGAEFAAIVVDSKSVNWGGVDENSNDENAAFIYAVRKHLVEPFGRPAVLITHHLTKQREKEVRSSRGGGALINNADHEWRFDMNQDARLSAMEPGSKVRMERWAQIRFSIKTATLPAKKFPQLQNNFGDMPRISVAEPVNQYNKSMKQLQADTEQREALRALASLKDQKKPYGLSHIAAELNWVDANEKPDYRKVKRILDDALTQKLVTPAKQGKGYEITKAGRDYFNDNISESDS